MTTRKNAFDKNDSNLVHTPLTGELVRVKRKYLQLRQSSERLGNGPYTSSTAAGARIIVSRKLQRLQHAWPTQQRRVVLVGHLLYVNVQFGDAWNQNKYVCAALVGQAQETCANYPFGPLTCKLVA